MIKKMMVVVAVVVMVRESSPRSSYSRFIIINQTMCDGKQVIRVIIKTNASFSISNHYDRFEKKKDWSEKKKENRQR